MPWAGSQTALWYSLAQLQNVGALLPAFPLAMPSLLRLAIPSYCQPKYVVPSQIAFVRNFVLATGKVTNTDGIMG